MTQSSNSQFAVLSNGLIINFSSIVGIQPNTSNKDEFYVHTTTPQYYKINKPDYTQFINDNFTLRDDYSITKSSCQ